MNAPFSAKVELSLIVAGERFQLGQLGPDFALLRTPQTIDAAVGVIETIIDDTVSRRCVRITGPPDGDSRRVEFESL
ncbi:hypothetical protein [Stieleria maiorica]|uniref:hypothetical protein n=1 Tax=Stieleria maiorica TaxID=2795974 RepID=UPI0011C7EDB3|nr:hypothetical protein [Stieleria maiorica]